MKERQKKERTDSKAKRKRFIATAYYKILHLKWPPGLMIHNFLPPQQQPASVIVALINASGHIQLQAAITQIPVTNE